MSAYQGRRSDRRRISVIGLVVIAVLLGFPLLQIGVGKLLHNHWGNVEFSSIELHGGGLFSRDIPLCTLFKRDNCVVSGNTIKLDGEISWIAGLRVPSVDGACLMERRLALRAARRLSEILSSEPFRASPSGFGQPGVNPVSISNGQGAVGSVLIREGLAGDGRGQPEDWCKETG
ncbi:hypothetical protein [Hoeflea sp. TYP-13]|uniref:hypothetical protein n=1 Tax=Hoeflea sp. TYP-13 TaxID=3230023 RepID=UPI0034C6B231